MTKNKNFTKAVLAVLLTSSILATYNTIQVNADENTDLATATTVTQDFDYKNPTTFLDAHVTLDKVTTTVFEDTYVQKGTILHTNHDKSNKDLDKATVNLKIQVFENSVYMKNSFKLNGEVVDDSSAYTDFENAEKYLYITIEVDSKDTAQEFEFTQFKSTKINKGSMKTFVKSASFYKNLGFVYTIFNGAVLQEADLSYDFNVEVVENALEAENRVVVKASLLNRSFRMFDKNLRPSFTFKAPAGFELYAVKSADRYLDDFYLHDDKKTAEVMNTDLSDYIIHEYYFLLKPTQKITEDVQINLETYLSQEFHSDFISENDSKTLVSTASTTIKAESINNDIIDSDKNEDTDNDNDTNVDVDNDTNTDVDTDNDNVDNDTNADVDSDKNDTNVDVDNDANVDTDKSDNVDTDKTDTSDKSDKVETNKEPEKLHKTNDNKNVLALSLTSVFTILSLSVFKLFKYIKK